MNTDHVTDGDHQNPEILKIAVEQSFDAIIIVDFQGRIVLANPAAEAMYRYPKGELAAIRVEELN